VASGSGLFSRPGGLSTFPYVRTPFKFKVFFLKKKKFVFFAMGMQGEGT
jgi:hypothetical protein